MYKAWSAFLNGVNVNSRQRKFSNQKYLNFLRKLPCPVTGKALESNHAHHVAVRGHRAVNDYFAITLDGFLHTGKGHITEARLTEFLKESPYEIIIFYLSLYVEYLEGRYDPEMDMAINFLDFRRKFEGSE